MTGLQLINGKWYYGEWPDYKNEEDNKLLQAMWIKAKQNAVELDCDHAMEVMSSGISGRTFPVPKGYEVEIIQEPISCPDNLPGCCVNHFKNVARLKPVENSAMSYTEGMRVESFQVEGNVQSPKKVGPVEKVESQSDEADMIWEEFKRSVFVGGLDNAKKYFNITRK